ncbi:MAG: DUF134 domain-containing protein [Verrucomicrobia bacterium]|nr:DUF134 domain-containing protein [Verrucomicrobiota bacterium]
MPRPISPREIEEPPEATWFKPTGIPMRDLEEVVLTFDEIEAIRLADAEGLYQEQVAEHMKVSRPTIGRILASARQKIAKALVQGKAIRIEGGAVYIRKGKGARPYCRRRLSFNTETKKGDTP